MTAKHIVFAGLTALFCTALPAQDLTVVKAGTLYQGRGKPLLKDVVVLIENGKITTPVKGAMLIGDGPEVLTKISMIGNDLALDSGVGT